ncbi:MAG TPA: radical SAM protein, partial [Archaeoglobus profundus]|nr:radical SAM protein [Archaeoglobus profundus]
RVKRCVIHYGTPDGRIIPFCAFNVLPEVYKDKIHAKYGITIEEWEKKTGKKLKDDIYRVVRRPKD